MTLLLYIIQNLILLYNLLKMLSSTKQDNLTLRGALIKNNTQLFAIV